MAVDPIAQAYAIKANALRQVRARGLTLELFRRTDKASVGKPKFWGPPVEVDERNVRFDVYEDRTLTPAKLEGVGYARYKGRTWKVTKYSFPKTSSTILHSLTCTAEQQVVVAAPAETDYGPYVTAGWI